MSSAVLAPGRRYQRELGTYGGERPGPTLLVCAGIHGNEPAGILAVQRFLTRLRDLRLPIAGRVEAIAGNLAALAQDQRFLARDLNRGWSPQRIDALLRSDPDADSPEDAEQRAMTAVFTRVEAEARGPLVFVDLHTSSGDSAPFTCAGDTRQNRRLAMALPVPLILGLEETIEDAVLDWFNVRGHAGLAIEGGQHRRPETVENHEAALWMLLVATGMVTASAVPDLAARDATLRGSARSAPPVVEITYRHVVAPGETFRMAPGFVSFQAVRKGEHMGNGAAGLVVAPSTGRVLLPLYQSQGDDGFFVGRDVRPFWLAIATLLRALRFDLLVRLLPGVRRAPTDRNTLLVNPRVARWFVVEVFHLLGYRKERRRGDRLVFSRRFANAAARSLPWRGPR